MDILELFANLAIAALTCVLAYYTYVLAKTTAASEANAKMPKIAAWIEPSPDDPFEFNFVLSNYSANPAYNVSVRPSEEVYILESKKVEKDRFSITEMFKEPIAVLPPHYSLKTILGVIPGYGSDLASVDLKRTVCMTISWKDGDGKSHEEVQAIDWRLVPTIQFGDTRKKMLRKSVDDLSHIRKCLESISVNMGRIASDEV